MKWMATPCALSGTSLGLLFSRVDPVLSRVLPASQLLWLEPEGDLLPGTLNRVAAVDHVPVGKKKGISQTKQTKAGEGSCSLENLILTNVIKPIKPVTPYNILSCHIAPPSSSGAVSGYTEHGLGHG